MPLRFKLNFRKLHKDTLVIIIGFSVSCTISCHNVSCSSLTHNYRNGRVVVWVHFQTTIYIYIIYTQSPRGLMNLSSTVTALICAILKVETSIFKDSTQKFVQDCLSPTNTFPEILSHCHIVTTNKIKPTTTSSFSLSS